MQSGGRHVPSGIHAMAASRFDLRPLVSGPHAEEVPHGSARNDQESYQEPEGTDTQQRDGGTRN